MPSPPMFTFGPFRLDGANETLWRGTERVVLKPKSLAVLRSLVERPHQLVTKDELLDAHWTDVAVGEAVLKTCIGEIRQALADDASAPTYIETVHRRGYRFVGSLTPTAQARSPRPLVGRTQELASLEHWWTQAQQGRRHLVFVTGEPGIGKTHLVDTFLTQCSTPGAVWIGRGQCVEHYGAGDAYLPLLEALGRLCRQPGGDKIVKVLKAYAPTWSIQLPGVLAPTELEGDLAPKMWTPPSLEKFALHICPTTGDLPSVHT